MPHNRPAHGPATAASRREPGTRPGEPRRGNALPLLRIGSALLILVSGGVHLVGWLGPYSVLPIIGPLFLLNACSALLLAIALTLAHRPRWWAIEPLVLLAAWGFAALTLAAFLLSATRGLFGFREALAGTAQSIAGIAEALTLLTTAGALALWLRRRPRRNA